MAKTIKLPADLRDWKVTSFVGEDNGCEVYKVSRLSLIHISEPTRPY